METKAFPTADVLSAVTGIVLTERCLDPVYEVLGWMTGEKLFTHQLPRVGREAKPVVAKLHPALKQAYEEAEQVNGDNWRQWVDTWIDRYGPMMTVPKMTAADHERIDPRSELAERVHPDNIIQIDVPSRPAALTKGDRS